MTAVVFGVATIADLAKEKMLALVQAAADAAAPDSALHGLQALYAYDGNMGPRTLYAGGDSSQFTEGAGERGVLVAELCTVVFYIREVQGPPATPVREADRATTSILTAVRGIMLANPTLDNVIEWVDITRTQGDYETHSDSTVFLRAFTTRFGAYIGR